MSSFCLFLFFYCNDKMEAKIWKILLHHLLLTHTLFKTLGLYNEII